MRLYFLIINLIVFRFVSNAETPKNDIAVFSTKYIHATSLKMAKWQLKNPRYACNDWTNAVFYSGILATWQMTKSPVLYDALMAMGNDSTQWLPGDRYFHADDIAISQTFIDLYRIEKEDRMIRPTIESIDQFIEDPYPVKDWEVVKWWWCDALFMGPPAMVKLGITLGDNKYLKYSDIYFKESYDLLYDKKRKLFSRALNYVVDGSQDDKFEANGEPIFWSRGNGWVMAGLAKILSELPKNYEKREFYIQLFKEMAASIVSLQPKDGLWRTSLLDPGSYPHGEVSGSSLFCYALAWGINEGIIDKVSYLPAVKKTWIALNNCIRPEGSIGWVQPIGANPDGRFSKDNWEVYGTGAFLLAASEIVKLVDDGYITSINK